MIKNIIFGKRSRLTSSLIKIIKNYEVISASEINHKKDILNDNFKKNYVFNNFYPSHELNYINPSHYEKFVNLSINQLIEILSNLKITTINKIIYTSSSSVNNIGSNLSNSAHDRFNRKLYASFKYASEKITENFCRKKNINFYIMRIYNTYGDKNDKFSFIENLIKTKKEKLNLTLINDGISIRDFIHLNDVASIYKKFLNKEYDSGIYDVGTGKGRLIRNLVDFVNIEKKYIIKKQNISESTKSIAELNKLKQYLGNFKFKSLEIYLRDKLKISSKKKIYSIKNKFYTNKDEGSVIYGAGFAGEKLYLKLKEQGENIIFFVDDDLKKQNTTLFNIPIISFKNLNILNKRSRIKKVFIAIPSLNQKKINRIKVKLSGSFFDTRYLPEKKFLVNNNINLSDIKNDQLNIFINRKPINIKKIANLKNQSILVTGAAGTIGFEICKQLIYQGAKKIIGIDHSEIAVYNKKNQIDSKAKLLLCDVNDHVLLDQIISKNKINLIIHAAAYKHVNILEENINTAIYNNVIGTKNVCKIAIKNNVNLILISTDKAVEPKSVLGYSKKVCEQIVHYYNSFNKKNYFDIVRFGNVFGSSGSAVTKFIEQINNNKPLTITNKLATRFFMTILEACYLVLETTSFKKKNKIFILNMGKPINIYQLAKKLGEYKKNLDPNYEIKFTETGLKKNEKLHERLFEKKELLMKINQNVFYVNNNKFDYKKFYKVFSDLEKNYKFYSKKKIMFCLKSISKI